MEFTSLYFILIVPFTVTVYCFFPSKTKPLMLLIISYLFCCSFMPSVLIPLWLITILSYIVGRMLAINRYRKLLLTVY